MILDVRKCKPPLALADVTDGITIRTLADLRCDPQHLEKLYALTAETEKDIPVGQATEFPAFESFALSMAESPSLDWEHVFVAVDGERFVGFTILYRNSASRSLYLGGTGVAPSHRRRGIAAALKRQGHAFAAERGYEALHSDNHVGNAAIIATNRKAGFVCAWEEIDFEKAL